MRALAQLVMQRTELLLDLRPALAAHLAPDPGAVRRLAEEITLATGLSTPCDAGRLSTECRPGGRSRSSRHHARDDWWYAPQQQPDTTTFGSHPILVQDPQRSDLVGMAGFEPAACCSQISFTQ